jgi:hypothetical protein
MIYSWLVILHNSAVRFLRLLIHVLYLFLKVWINAILSRRFAFYLNFSILRIDSASRQLSIMMGVHVRGYSVCYLMWNDLNFSLTLSKHLFSDIFCKKSIHGWRASMLILLLYGIMHFFITVFWSWPHWSNSSSDNFLKMFQPTLASLDWLSYVLCIHILTLDPSSPCDWWFLIRLPVWFHNLTSMFIV